jgi:hypothetical protein
VLAAMPKCPACLAAYLAAATGLRLSLPVAAKVRLGLIILSRRARVILPFARSRGADDGIFAAVGPQSSWGTRHYRRFLHF